MAVSSFLCVCVYVCEIELTAYQYTWIWLDQNDHVAIKLINQTTKSFKGSVYWRTNPYPKEYVEYVYVDKMFNQWRILYQRTTRLGGVLMWMMLLQIMEYAKQRIPVLNEFCVVCDEPHVFENGPMLRVGNQEFTLKFHDFDIKCKKAMCTTVV